MDLHERRQLDRAERMARVNQHVAKARTRARPWRSIIALVLAVAAGVVAAIAASQFKFWTAARQLHPEDHRGRVHRRVLRVRRHRCGRAGRQGPRRAHPAVGTSHAAVVRYAILLVGGVTVLVIAISLCKVPIGQLLVGGAVTTILLGIAGQQSLANIFAGLVLLLSRPFNVGDYIRVKSGALGGVTDGLVTEIGITYLRLDTEDGSVNMPNSQVLAAATGPIPRPGGAPPAAAAGQGAPAQALPAAAPPAQSPPDQAAAPDAEREHGPS